MLICIECAWAAGLCPRVTSAHARTLHASSSPLRPLLGRAWGRHMTGMSLTVYILTGRPGTCVPQYPTQSLLLSDMHRGNSVPVRPLRSSSNLSPAWQRGLLGLCPAVFCSLFPAFVLGSSSSVFSSNLRPNTFVVLIFDRIREELHSQLDAHAHTIVEDFATLQKTTRVLSQQVSMHHGPGLVCKAPTPVLIVGRPCLYMRPTACDRASYVSMCVLSTLCACLGPPCLGPPWTGPMSHASCHSLCPLTHSDSSCALLCFAFQAATLDLRYRAVLNDRQQYKVGLACILVVRLFLPCGRLPNFHSSHAQQLITNAVRIMACSILPIVAFTAVQTQIDAEVGTSLTDMQARQIVILK